MSDIDYAGDISPTEAWSMLTDESDAVLIDVRTDAEFAYVGSPDLSTLKKPVHRISWKLFPDMRRNPHFEEAVKEVAPSEDVPILFFMPFRRALRRSRNGDGDVRLRALL